MEQNPRQQIRPVPAGTAIVRAGTLTVRAPGGELVVRAPSRYVRAVADWCDGDTSIAAMADRAHAKWGPTDFPAFVLSLLDAGVLTDAPVAVLRALRQPSAGLPASSNPHEPGDAELAESHLDQLARVLRQSDPQARLRLAFVVLRPVGAIAEGVYGIDRAGHAQSPHLHRQCAFAAAAWRALPPPLLQAGWPVLLLVCASGTAAPRAAVLQAGAIAHIAREWAMRQNIGWAGDVNVEGDRLLASCGLTEQHLLYAAAIGGHRDAEAGEEEPPCLEWMDLPEHRGLCIARATPPTPAGERPLFVAWGRSHDPRQAAAKALGEYAERQALRLPVDAVQATMAELPGAVHPGTLVAYSRRQLTRHADRLKPFAEGDKLRWVRGKEWATGKDVWLAADCVETTLVPNGRQGPRLARPTSSGCAADADIGTAIERATYELIERDAFARHWLAQSPGMRIEPASLPAAVQRRAHALQAQGCDTFVVCLSQGLGPAILVLVRNDSRGFVCAGSACGHDLALAIEHAFTEAEFAAVARCTARRPPPARAPRDTSSPQDHADLFARRAYFRRADVLIGTRNVPASQIAWPSALQDRLQTRDGPHKVYWTELPGTGAPRQADGRRARTVRALIPGCIPLAFGFGALPEAMVPHAVSPAARFPHPLP